MTAAHRHPSGVSATHSQIVLGLIVILAFAVLAPRAAGDASPPGTTTDQVATVSDPAADPAPVPDPAPQKKTPPPAPSHSAPVKHSTAPSHQATPVQPPAPAIVNPPARQTVVPRQTVVQPSPVRIPAAPAPHTAATSTPHPSAKPRHPIAKKPVSAAPAEHPRVPSPALERPPVSPAVPHSGPAGSTPPTAAIPPHPSLRHVVSPAAHSTVARDLVLVLDAAAVLLLVLALVPESVLQRPSVQRRSAANRAVRLRPSIAAAGISLLSASLILFMLNLSGPVP